MRQKSSTPVKVEKRESSGIYTEVTESMKPPSHQQEDKEEEEEEEEKGDFDDRPYEEMEHGSVSDYTVTAGSYHGIVCVYRQVICGGGERWRRAMMKAVMHPFTVVTRNPLKIDPHPLTTNAQRHPIWALMTPNFSTPPYLKNT